MRGDDFVEGCGVERDGWVGAREVGLFEGGGGVDGVDALEEVGRGEEAGCAGGGEPGGFGEGVEEGFEGVDVVDAEEVEVLGCVDGFVLD